MKFGAARTKPVQIGPTLIGPARTDVAQVIIDAPSRGARPPVHRRPPVYLAQVTTAGGSGKKDCLDPGTRRWPRRLGAQLPRKATAAHAGRCESPLCRCAVPVNWGQSRC